MVYRNGLQLTLVGCICYYNYSDCVTDACGVRDRKGLLREPSSFWEAHQMPVYTSQNLTVTDSQQAYLHPGSYKSTSTDQAKRIKRLIKILVDIVTPPFDHAYIRHQWEKHGNVPLWVAVKAMTLGNVSQMYSLLPDRIQAHVSKEFPCVSGGHAV